MNKNSSISTMVYMAIFIVVAASTSIFLLSEIREAEQEMTLAAVSIPLA